jgi:sigma-B regulation protein RsbU (phosphoserine phosphatase)
MQQPSEDRLALLYRVTQTFNSSLDLDEVLNWVMDEVITATHAERGFVMLYDESGQLNVRSARGMDQRTIESPAFEVSRGIVERVANEGQPILTSDAQTDSRFSSRKSVMILGLRSILCVPLKTKDKTIGVTYVDNRLQAGIFTAADLELLSAIASSAAIAIENARLYQVAVEKGRMERELQMARRVQNSLLPAEMPQISGWDFAAQWQPAREVGGDYYDFIPVIRSRSSSSKLGLVIADVTDKGMPAALFMAFTRSIIRASMSRADYPVASLTQANELICAESNKGLFVTLFYAQLDLPTGEITYVNAGHNPAILCQLTDNDPQVTLLTATGMPLGVEPDQTFEQRSLALKPEELIVMYTDGVIDALNSSGQDFGMDRLQEVIRANPTASAITLLDAIMEAVNNFTGSITPFDDITILVVKRLAS